MSDKKIIGYNKSLIELYKPSLVTNWCICKSCKTEWHEEYMSPGEVCINGPWYYDYCSECPSEKKE